jgi:hypothetical protein
MVRKSPDKQWNRQHSILFHETIPLIINKKLCVTSWKGLTKKPKEELVHLQISWRFAHTYVNRNFYRYIKDFQIVINYEFIVYFTNL